MADLLVRGGQVLDGTGRPSFDGDVRVRDGVIAEVGARLEPDGEEILDADGAYVTPGFIDVHTHYDGAMWWDRTVDPMPLHGVTTMVTGNCAISLSPVSERDRSSLVDMFCYIEDLPVAPVAEAVPWTWSSWTEFREAFNADGASCNIAPLVGHNNLRMAVLGDASFERAATDDERAHIVDLLADCLDAGAYGVSLSFVDSDSRGRRVPSRSASADERGDLAATLARLGRGVVQHVPRFMRTEGYLKDLEKIDAMCRPYGITQTFAPVPAVRRTRETTDAVLERTRMMQREGASVWPQVSPRAGLDTRVVFDSALLFAGMPAWAELSQASGPDRVARLTDPAWVARAREDWDSPAFTMFPKANVDGLMISEVTNPQLSRFEGHAFAEVLAAWPGHPAEVLARWILETDAEPCLVKPGSADADFDLLGALLADDATLVGGSDAGAHALLFCGAGDTTLLLTKHVRERHDLSLELAVHKLTGLAADAMGIRDRGVIRPGLAADLNVFTLDELRFERERLVADLPGGNRRFTRPAGGYRATLVAGTVTQVEGRATGSTPGRMLHSASARG
jgi:N-acyl-D-amino-acid deacylase